MLATLADLTDADLGKTITIRGEPHTVQQALLRGLSHTAYHVGQICLPGPVAEAGRTVHHDPPRSEQGPQARLLEAAGVALRLIDARPREPAKMNTTPLLGFASCSTPTSAGH